MFSIQTGLRRRLTAAALASGVAASLAALPAKAEETIKVGILHSLSGTMAISETTLKDVMLMLIEEQNAKGGLLGMKLEPVVVDPASDWPLFAEKARELITQDQVAAVFGCWTSVSRKSVLPVFEELNSLLFYPVQYEGEESSKNVFYTGAAPNQQAIPAVDYLMNEEEVERWVLAGTDYVYPRTTNKILEAYLKAKGVAAEDIMINYTPFGHADWQTIVSDIKTFGCRRQEDRRGLDHQRRCQRARSTRSSPTRASSPRTSRWSPSPSARRSLAGIDTGPLVGHLAAWNYFQSVETAINEEFVGKWKAFIGDEKRVTNDPMEAHYIGFNMWVEGGREGRHHRSGRRRRGDHRRDRPEPDRRLRGDDAEPPHHQAGADRRDPGRRPVRGRWETPSTGGRRRMVRLPAGLEGPDLRLARPAVLRQLQHRHRQVRRPRQLTSAAGARGATAKAAVWGIRGQGGRLV